MVWKIKFDARAERELKKLDPQTSRRIIFFFHDRLAKLKNPRILGEALSGPKFGELWKYRIGDYRAIVSMEDKILTILLLVIGHRREV